MQTVFEISRNIYKRDYKKIEEVYRDQEFSSELGIVIGEITESPELFNQALERKGGRMNMCTALEDLKKEGKIEGKIEGRIEGKIEGRIEGRILTYFEFGVSPEEIAKKVKLTVKEVENVLEENEKLNLIQE